MPKKGESKKQRVSEQIIGPLGDPGSLYFQMKQFLQYQRERSYSERTVGNRESLLIAFIFPNDPAITRLVGAMLLEQNDEWCLQRRYMQLEAFEAVSDNPQAKLSAVIN